MISSVLLFNLSTELSELCSGSVLVPSPNNTIDTEQRTCSPKRKGLNIMLYTTTLLICIIKYDIMGLMFVYMNMFVGRIQCQNDDTFGQYEHFSRIAILLVYILLESKT